MANTFLNYDPAFMQFIKTFLINTCYMEYSKTVYQSNDHLTKDEYVDFILLNKNDTELWDSIFNKANDLFHYYLHLSTNYHSVLPNHQTITYSQQQTSNTYQQLTFQEYIDKSVSYENIGYREYQKFIKSMDDINFRNNLFEKYKRDSEERALKNYLIYVIHLYISKYIRKSTLFSMNELEDMDVMMNAIPYFEYLADNNITLDDIRNRSNSIDLDMNMKQIAFLQLQLRVFDTINTIL